MEKEKDEEKNNTISRQIGTTTYRIRVFFNNESKDSMEEKILRMIRTEVVTNTEKCGILKQPQMSRPA